MTLETDDGGALSVEQAEELLTNGPDVDAELGDDDTGEPQEETGEEVEAEETEETLEGDDEGEDEADPEEEAEEPEPEPIEPPQFFRAEDKEKFTALTPEAQAMVVEYENERNRSYQMQQQKYAETRKGFEQAVDGYFQKTQTILTESEQRMADWQKVDFQQMAGQLDPQEYNQLTATYEQDRRAHEVATHQAQEARNEQMQQHHNLFVKELPEVAPDLADPEKGSERRGQVVRFLQERGYTAEEISFASARDSQTAWEALQYRNLKKGTVPGKPKPKPTARAKKAPKSAARSSSTSNAKLKQAQAAFDKNPSTQNAERLMILKG